MSDAPNNSSDRLEGLLRQWGKLTDAQRQRALDDPHVAVRHAAVGYRHGKETEN